MKKLVDKLESLPVTIVSGLFLLAGFLLPRLGVSLPAVSWQTGSYTVTLTPDPAWVTVLLSGIPLVYLAITRLIHNRGLSKISSALLISVAMVAAILLGDLFAAGEVAFIMAIGELLEDFTTDRARRGLHKLISMTPETALRISDGKEERIPASEIRAGDVLRVLPGERIPADGTVLRGETAVDQSVLTGESMPVEKAPGDKLWCGTVNRFGSADFRADAVGEDSSLQKMIRLVREAEERKAPAMRIADKWASVLVPAALLVAVIAWLVTGEITRGVTVLVVFCPCALVLATPTAIMAAIGQAASRGVIIKSGEALELMGKVDTLAFDKTGTLTKGTPAVSEILPCGEFSEEQLLRLTAAAEKRSEHPLGKAIAACTEERGLRLPEAEEFRMDAGRGIRAVVSGREILCGNDAYLRQNGVTGAFPETDAAAAQGKAAVYVAADGKPAGVVVLSDAVRPEVPEVIRALDKLELESVMLTGDNRRAAAAVAESTGIRSIRAELLPGEKSAALEHLKAGGKTVCMLGDGVNDAPALKTADVGIAMGDVGSDIAVEAADIALTRGSLKELPYLIRLSRAAVKTIRFGITLSMLINLAAVTLSVLGLLNPTTGALVHNAGSVLVVAIAALLYDRKF